MVSDWIQGPNLPFPSSAPSFQSEMSRSIVFSQRSAPGGEVPGERKGPTLLMRLRQAIRQRHYSRRTEETYVGWVKRFVAFHGRRHPAELGRRGKQFPVAPCFGPPCQRLNPEPGAECLAVSVPCCIGQGSWRAAQPGLCKAVQAAACCSDAG